MYAITDACIACDLCVTECPISAIERGFPIYVINETCCDFAECVDVCPVDAIVLVENLADAAAEAGTEKHPE